MSWRKLEDHEKPGWTTPKIIEAWTNGTHLLVEYEGTHWTLYREYLYLHSLYETATPEDACAWADLMISEIASRPQIGSLSFHEGGSKPAKNYTLKPRKPKDYTPVREKRKLEY